MIDGILSFCFSYLALKWQPSACCWYVSQKLIASAKLFENTQISFVCMNEKSIWVFLKILCVTDFEEYPLSRAVCSPETFGSICPFSRHEKTKWGGKINQEKDKLHHSCQNEKWQYQKHSRGHENKQVHCQEGMDPLVKTTWTDTYNEIWQEKESDGFRTF